MISLFTNLPVFVQTLKVPTFYLKTQPSYTIGHIKTMIQEKKGVPSDELKLGFADQLLEDGHTLSDYNIQDGSVIYIGRQGSIYWGGGGGGGTGGSFSPKHPSFPPPPPK